MSGASLLVAVAASLAVGVLLQPLVVRLMTAAAVIDTPCERSSHTLATPRGGGIAVVSAVAAGLALADAPARVFAIPLLLFAAIGLWEDLRGASVPTRLGLQLAAGVFAAALLVRAADPAPTTAAAAAVVVVLVTLWLTAYTNAFNFMDGVNGISAAHAALAGTAYAFLGLRYDLTALTAAGGVVAAAALSFLPFNAGRAVIFLGDVGSYGLGGVLGATAAYGLLCGLPPQVVAAPLALYLADTGWTLARRWWRGDVWYQPHRDHAYQRLTTDAGWSHQRVTAVTVLASAAVCGCVLAAARTDPTTRAALDTVAVLILLAYLAAPGALADRRRGSRAHV